MHTMFFDLDHTVIHPIRGYAHDAAITVEYFNGNPLSYMTPTALSHLAWLTNRGLFTPVTTRTFAQYSRIILPGYPTWEIAFNGGHIRRNGEEDREWSGHIRSLQPESMSYLRGRHKALAERTGTNYYENEYFHYVVMPKTMSHEQRENIYEEFTELALPEWDLHMTGRKLYAIPLGCTKDAAARYVNQQENTPQALFASDDSHVGVDMMLNAATAITSRTGNAHTTPHGTGIPQTSKTGVEAGEEILEAAVAIAQQTGY